MKLAPLTTFKVGGAARLFVEAKTEDQLINTAKFCKENDLPLFILGGGSNVLISDQGFDGLVLKVDLKGIEKLGNQITAQAGEDWDEFVNYCVENNLQGIECLSGIPGLVGGTPVQNVGAYGQEVSETIEKVRVFDRKSEEIFELSNTDCKFSYRSSIFNSTEKNRFIVLAVTFRLNLNGKPKIVYKDLQNYFGKKRPTLIKVRDAVCQIRAEKAMLVRQGGLDSQSAGSFFKNPIIAKEKFEEIQAKFNEKVPSFPVGENSVKIPAAWLIENSGFARGFTLGNAGLSTKHTLAITNRGNATAAEILKLKTKIQETVKAKFSIELHPEPVFLGIKDEG
ncbi:MAG: UDP-N-acetylmuramate dehydrogenase [Pyrinomonadaceae bacterium]|nr:UDP-N-acetylmuramate dehydrogenase [Pyrinomonadaceae bacterium]